MKVRFQWKDPDYIARVEGGRWGAPDQVLDDIVLDKLKSMGIRGEYFCIEVDPDTKEIKIL